MDLTAKQEEMCRQDRWDFSDLRAMFVNCTLKRSPEVSNTEALAGISMEIMRRNGINVEAVEFGCTGHVPQAPSRVASGQRSVTSARSGRGQAARCRRTTVISGYSRSTKPQVRGYMGRSTTP